MPQIKGLTPETANVFEEISRLDCIKGLYLCGGTSISLQIGHRLSEDLDFELIGTRRERDKLNFSEIISEVTRAFPGSEREILGSDHFQMFLPNRVKLSFFRPVNPVPQLTQGYKYNNIVTPTLQELLGMKLYTTTVRNVFRDYYDIYCLLQHNLSFTQALKYALDFTRHTVHTKKLLSTITTPQLFLKETDFDERMSPRYTIDSDQIAQRIREEIASL